MKTLKISAEIIDLDIHQHFLELRFPRRVGPLGRLRVPNAERRNPRLVLRDLDNAGALLPTSGKKALKLVEALLSEPAPRVRYSTSRIGWVDDGSFVLPHRTLGKGAKTLHHRPNAALYSVTWTKSGTLEGWQSGMKQPCQCSSYLLFATAVAFAGPLLNLINETEGAFFNLTGESSTGKTLASRVAQSTFTRANKTDLIPASLTDRGLEEIAFAHNNLVVVIDELGSMKGSEQTRREKIRARAYELAGGRGTMRSQSVHQTLPSLEWALFGFTSWELPLNELSRARGEMVRFFDVPIPSPAEGGIFDLLVGLGNARLTEARAMAVVVEDTIARNHGVAIEPYLERLVEDRTGAVAMVKEIVAEFVQSNCAGGDAWDVRFATKFGIVLAAARLAADWGIGPWSAEPAEDAVQAVYEAAVAGTATPEEMFDNFLQHVRRAIGDNRRFPVVEEKGTFPKKLKKKAWGFKRKHRNQGSLLVVRPKRFERLCGSVQRRAVIVSKLKALDILWAPQGNTPTAQLYVQGLSTRQRTRFYCLRKKGLLQALATAKRSGF